MLYSPAADRLFNLMTQLLELGFTPQDQAIIDIAYQLTEVVAADESPLWVGVEERAVQLGYPSGLVSQKRSQLGLFVARAGLVSRKVEQYCYGKLCEVNQYLVTPELDAEIKGYFKG